ncbi:MAG: glycosyltransferase [Magnetococcales bacterium]|nr:glycosyltransferase [Magnetococcales bacterium]
MSDPVDNTPRVTVLMAVCNAGDFLALALTSILTQSLAEFEFVVVDDGSTDGSAEVLARFALLDRRLVILENGANLGLTRSLNRGLGRARGRYVARQDADDLSLPERLARQVAFLDRHPEIGFVGSAAGMIDAHGEVLEIRRHPVTDTEIRWMGIFHNPFFHTSVMFRRELVPNDGRLYDERFSVAQDYDLWVRLLQRTRGANLRTPLVCHRLHERRTSRTRREEQRQVALTVPGRQMRELLPGEGFDDTRVVALRALFLARSPRAGWRRLADSRIMVRLFRRFSWQSGLDPRVVSRLAAGLVGHLLGEAGWQIVTHPGLALDLWRLDARECRRGCRRRIARFGRLRW